MPITFAATTTIGVLDHAIDRFMKRCPERLPEGADRAAARSYIIAIARKGLQHGWTAFGQRSETSAEVVADGIRMIMAQSSKHKDTLLVITCMPKEMDSNRNVSTTHQRKRNAKRKHVKEASAERRRIIENPDDGW